MGRSFILIHYHMRYALLFISCFLATHLTAQQDLRVQVTDYQANQPASNVIVELINTSRGIQLKLTTDEQGIALFRSLPAVDGFQIFIRETDLFLESTSNIFGVRSNQNPTIDLLLLSKKSYDLAPVDIVAKPSAQINRTNAEVAFELQQKEIEEIPVEGRDITRVLYRLPNVSQATGFYPEAPNVSINGANSLFTSYLIDGFDNNERFLGGQKFAIPSGFAKNITVLTNNYSAEYGLTGNGVINITSRSGTNNHSGEAFFITRPGPVIDGESLYAQRDLSGNQVKDGFQRYQGGVALGGPIKKDQTFFYVDVEHTTDLKDNFLVSSPLSVAETVRGNNQFTYLSGKIDHKWSNAFRSSIRANVGIVSIERQGGGLEGGVTFPSAGNAQDRNSLLLASKNTYVGKKFSAETNIQFARFRWNYARPNNEGSPQVVVQGPSGSTIAVLGHPGYIFDAIENTLQFQQKFNYYAGRHTLKAGIGIISADHSLFGGGNENGAYSVRLNNQQLQAVRALNRGSNLSVTDIPNSVEVLNYNVELRPASFGTQQTIYSAYLEDQIEVNNKLRLTLGLRYDYDNLSVGGGTKGDYNNLAPRINANYKLSQRSVLRAGYGIFYDKVLYAIYSDALQQNTTSDDYRAQLQALIDQGILPSDTDIDAITFDGNLTASTSNTTYLNGPTPDQLQEQREGVFSNERRILNPNGYDNPFTHQFTLGYQLQMDNDRLFFVDLVHNRSENLYRLRNLNAAASYSITADDVANTNNPSDLVRSVSDADASRPIPIIDGSYAVINGQRRNGVARNVVITEAAGQSRYYAASFNFQKARGMDNYSLRINYTLSFLENNTEDINFRAMDSNNFADEWGPSINDRRHIINGIFNYYPTDNLTVTLAGLIQSGQPINRIPDARQFGTTDLNGDGSSFGDAYVGNSDRYPGEHRNNDRLPWANTLDVALQYLIPVGGGKIALRADIFNVFNAQNLSGYSNNATQSNQIQPGPRDGGILIRRNASAPRQFQFGLSYFW